MKPITPPAAPPINSTIIMVIALKFVEPRWRSGVNNPPLDELHHEIDHAGPDENCYPVETLRHPRGFQIF